MAEKDVVLTPSQQAVVDDRGGALLVSAAAGSGKTKVLVDRLLAQVCAEDAPADLDDFLIITYTKAAAAELRGKIAKELSKRLSAEPENVHLQRQLTRIYLAQISTVHAFCSSILREYAHTLDIPADFRVAEELEAQELQQEVLDALLEQCYEDLTEDSPLRPLIDQFGYGRDDRRLAKLVLPVYSAVRCRVDPDAWMRRCEEAYAPENAMDAAQTPWGRALIARLRETTAWVRRNMQQAVDAMARDAVLQEKYAPKFLDNIEAVASLEAREGWDEIYENRLLSFGSVPPVRSPEDAELKETVQNIRKEALAALKDAQACFYAPSAQVLADLQNTAGPIRALLSLLREFDRQYAQEKRRRKLMDFSDLEHEAIRLLCQKGTALPTAAAKEIGARFREILVDEYQDSNAVQERIFEALSRGGRNRFMVGDVKQSIYRFRLADPSIFLEKYKSFPMRDDAAQGEPRKILLSENFRSRPEILQAVNDVFSLVMSPEAAELSYGEEEALRCGIPEFPATPQTKVELHCIDLDISAAEDEQKAEKREEEAAFVAARIHELLSSETMIADKGVLRPAVAGDITILLHSPGPAAAEYVAALARYQIACVTDRGGSILDTTEVEVLCAILQIIDNPHQDVPLAAAMASHVFGFTPDELARVRGCNRKSDLYDCLCMAAETDEKLQGFLNWLETEREHAGQMTLLAFLDEVIASTGLEEIYASMPDGTHRAENLRVFRALAADYAASRGGTLVQFCRYLAGLRESGAPISPPQSEAGADAVRIMSIHKSKGLEFPIVILADLSRKFNLQDCAAPVLLDDELLIGANVVNTQSGSYYPGIAKMAIAARKKNQTIAEEMRVLYVAMTRAKDMLIMTDCAAKQPQRLRRLNAALTEPVRPEIAGSVLQMGDWVMMAALCRTEAGELHAQAGGNAVSRVRPDPWRITFQSAQALRAQQSGAAGTFSDLPAARAELPELEAQLSYVYPHMAAAKTASKLTATQLKGRLLDREAAENAKNGSVPETAVRRPNFRKETPLTGREKGSATHLFMQFARYENCTDAQSAAAELERLRRERFLTAPQAEAVDCGRIVRLFESPFGARILSAEALRREFKFSILTDAGAYDPEAAGEQVMLQGVVDCFWEEDGGLVIVDFKTDRVYGDPARKAADYTPQLEAYAQALSRIFEKPVREKYLYFFDCGEAVRV